MAHIVVGTAGHIDHGKSALVQALTGIDPDRLKEEKARGITIELGFAHTQIEGLTVAFLSTLMAPRAEVAAVADEDDQDSIDRRRDKARRQKEQQQRRRVALGR